MSDTDDKDSKTEEPTEKKIKDALDKGQTPQSRELPILVSLTVFTGYVTLAAGGLVHGLTAPLKSLFEHSGDIRIGTFGDTVNFYSVVVSSVFQLMAPLLVSLLLAGVAAAVMQNEPRMVIDRIVPKLSKISIIKGWSRVFGKQGLVEFIKSLSKMLLVGTIIFIVLTQSVQNIVNGMFMDTIVYADYFISLIVKLLASVCLIMTVITVPDLIWSRFSWRQNLRMTRKEVTDEMKQAEGDPIFKARMRSMAQDKSRKRMMDAVPTATLILANPTHVSVALRFDPDQDQAPVLVAKGQDYLALKIREIAAEHNVPIFENVELARALNKSVKVDQMIPPAFYEAVAQLISVINNRPSRPIGI